MTIARGIPALYQANERAAVQERTERAANKGINPTTQAQTLIAKRLADRLNPREMRAEGRREWIESKLIIRDKQRQIVPLHFNRVQNMIWKTWEDKGFSGIRQNLVKFRQGGLSTLVLAYFFEEALRVPNTHVAIVSRDGTEVRRKLMTMKIFHSRLPDWEKPTLKYDNVNEMRFAGLESTIWVGAAGNRAFGRGDTIHKVLCSELAFYPDAEGLLTGLQEAVPSTGDIIIESTANGAGTFHHGHYLDARDNAESPWMATFLPWFEHEEYQEFEGPPLDLTAEETKVSKAFGLSAPQLRWRRSKKAALKGMFPQEYPETDDEAFLYSGRPRFDRAALLDIQKTCLREPIRIEQNGALRIFTEPAIDEVDGKAVPRAYTLGADAAEGLAVGDFDSAHVVDDATGEEVAVLHGKWPLHEYADLLADLGREYNTAFLAVERNNHGHAVLQRLLLGGENREAYPKRSLYHHRSFDAKAGSHVEKLGWPTDAVTKPQMTANLETLILEHPECFRDKQTNSELLTIVYLDDGGVGAPTGSHDDRFISRSIAEHVRKTHARHRGSISIVSITNYVKSVAPLALPDPRGEETTAAAPRPAGRWEPTEAELAKIRKRQSRLARR